MNSKFSCGRRRRRHEDETLPRTVLDAGNYSVRINYSYHKMSKVNFTLYAAVESRTRAFNARKTVV